MKKRILRVCLLAALLLAFGPYGTTAYAEEVTVSLVCVEQAEAGSSFSAALEYRGESFQSAVLEISYDPQVLQFRSCSGGEGFAAEDGLARITLSGGDGRAYLSCKIRFRALTEGESFITVTTSSLLSGEGTSLVAETRSVKVTVLPETVEAAGSDVVTEVSSSHDAAPEGGLLGMWAWVKDGIESGNFARLAGDGIRSFMEGLSIMEFLVLSLCVSMIVLLLVLLAAEKGKRRR